MTDQRLNPAAWLALPGAVAGDETVELDQTTVALHYGNPIAEQRNILAGALVDRSDKAVIKISGVDRLSWLDSFTSQALAELPPNSSTQFLILDPNGRIEQLVNLYDDGESSWLTVDAANFEKLNNWLTRMKFRAQLEIIDLSSQYRVIGTRNYPNQHLAGFEFSQAPVVWQDNWSEVSAGGVSYSDETNHPAKDWSWYELLILVADYEQLAKHLSSGELQNKVAGLSAWNALRIAAWQPALLSEVDERSLPHELDLLRSAVHLNKGCYRGQETVAKVHNLGHPPRRLSFLHLDGSESQLPKAGDEVFLASNLEKSVGKITSAAVHYELGPIALAVLKRTTPANEQLVVISDAVAVAASQEAIVSPDAGATVTVPKLNRRV